ncbi:MAG: glycosyltransferase family 39 protein [Proteobacteria bacterium]|nr:glycosyltransferase family 39 protein [Pseudomonadota bacterium]
MNIIVCLLTSLLLNLYGVDWGLPSPKKTALVFPVARENEKLFGMLKEGMSNKQSEAMHSFNRYGMDNHKGLEFFPDRFPRDERMQTFLRSYLLATCQEGEYSVVSSVSGMKGWRLSLNPRFFRYGGCFVYTVGFVLKVTSLFEWTSLPSDLSSSLNNPDAVRRVYIAGRLVMVIAVMLSCLLLYLLGKSLYGREAGLLAALAFGVSPGVVASAHTMKPYIFGVCFILLFLMCTVKMKNSGTRYSYVLAGIFLGLAAGSSLSFLIFFFHLFICHLLRTPKGGIRAYAASLKEGNFLLALGSVLLALLLTNPHYLLSCREVFTEMSFRIQQVSFSLSSEQAGQFAFSFFWMIHGITLSLIIAVGLFFSLTRGREYWFLPLLPVLYFLLMSAIVDTGDQTYLDFSLSLVPFTALLAGIGAQNLLAFQKRWIRVLLLLVLTVTFFHSLLYSYNFKQDTSQDSTFYRAGAWINHTVPQGSSIGLLHTFTPTTTPPFDFRKFRIAIYAPQDLSSRKTQLSQYFISARRIDDLLVPHYQLLQSFSPSWPLSTLGFKDHFTRANPPVFIYKRIQESGARIQNQSGEQLPPF